ncbi:hypothetical protein J4557_02305 [Actinomadura nitritigenes]|uniref:Uncharacterized protein n=1 Tax=Actinomadura nitritigenes TaxID=134602 RepID=A0ABS3QR68_9ACTN|nr:hypothetical protein [Actinomadura nitritigenes]MBO2436341.1 hypothetical protein [Actinomadura nitritigenes]
MDRLLVAVQEHVGIARCLQQAVDHERFVGAQDLRLAFVVGPLREVLGECRRPAVEEAVVEVGEGVAGVEDAVAVLGEPAVAAGLAALDLSDGGRGVGDQCGELREGQVREGPVAAHLGAEEVQRAAGRCEALRALRHVRLQ